MKRRAFLKHLNRCGCILLREGAKHSIDINADGSNKCTVPRHTEIKDHLARQIRIDLRIAKPDENLKLTNNSDDESCDVI